MFTKSYPIVISLFLLFSSTVVAEEISDIAVEDATAAKAEAETAKAEAEAAKVEAEAAKAEAEAAKTEAETAKTEAEAAKTEAVEVKEAVESQAIIQQTLTTEAEDATSGKDASKEKPKGWIPSAKDFDWIQLTSNEWLKGEMKAMYQESLEFDSDKLDLLEIDWEDVKILRGHKESSINIEGYEPFYGKLEVTDDVVQVVNDERTLTFDRLEVISFAPSGERERDLWSIKATLSLDIKRGNTDQFDYTAKVGIKRRASKSRFVLDYIGNISRTDAGTGEQVETLNNHRITANYDYYKTRHFFYNPVFAELFSDEFLNIELRTQVGTGLGYTVIDDGTSELSFSGGPAFVKTDFVSVLAGEDDSESSGALVLRTNYDTALSSTLDFIVKYNIQYGNEKSGGYTHHAIATFESELTRKLDIDVSLIWDRISKPTKDADGNTPEADDYRLTVGVTYTY